MASINKATIIGFVGQEPKVDTLQTGTKVTQFSVATTEKGYTTQGGTTVPDRTEWHNIVLWGKLADVAGQYLHKGSMVYVEGKIRRSQRRKAVCDRNSWRHHANARPQTGQQPNTAVPVPTCPECVFRRKRTKE